MPGTRGEAGPRGCASRRARVQAGGKSSRPDGRRRGVPSGARQVVDGRQAGVRASVVPATAGRKMQCISRAFHGPAAAARLRPGQPQAARRLLPRGSPDALAQVVASGRGRRRHCGGGGARLGRGGAEGPRPERACTRARSHGFGRAVPRTLELRRPEHAVAAPPGRPAPTGRAECRNGSGRVSDGRRRHHRPGRPPLRATLCVRRTFQRKRARDGPSGGRSLPGGRAVR